MAVLAVFVSSSTEAAPPTLNNPAIIPDDSRVDGIEPMQFTIEYEDTDGDFPTSFKVVFDGVSTEVDMVCAADEDACNSGANPDGIWVIADGNEPLAETLVASVGSDEISYNFIAVTDEGNNCYLSCDAWIDSDVRVNTVPTLADDAAVSGGGMPEDDYTLTITYTDADDHPGTVTATVCDTAASPCEDVSLSTADTNFKDGAVYSAIFNTELGGTLTVTVSATDTHDDAEDDRTTTFTVDTQTPWIKNVEVSETSAGEDEEVTFSAVYCVFDTTSQGTISMFADVGSETFTLSSGSSSPDCKNGVDYSITTEVDWASGSQDIIFSGSNDNGDAEDIEGLSITINDAPTLSAGGAERHSDGDSFVLSVTAADVNSDDGDTMSVYASIEFDDTGERVMSCTAGDCTLTVAEADIIDQRGGIRAVTFRVEDTHVASTSEDFGNTIDVAKTSSFILTGPGDQSPNPGLNDYTFTVENNGNFEDTFAISASSLNSWVSDSSDASVTVAYGGSDTFTIVMDVPHVAAGTTDSWSVDVTAGNDNAQSDSDSGTTTVATVSGHTVSIADASSNADPGATATYYFTITNTGNADESFTYEYDSVIDTTESLGMGESATVAASHTVPSNAGAVDSFTLTFTSGSESASAITTANQIYGVSIVQTGGDEPSTINPGDSFTIEYTVTNTGNGADSISVSFNAGWLSGTSGTSLSLAGGATGTATATLTAPADAASSSSSSISASATGAGSSGNSGSYSLSVNSASRSVSLSGTDSYTVNQGSSTEGTVTVTNDGVAATFIVIAMSDKVTFTTSEISLGAGEDGDMSFTLYAGASGGPFSFTIADTVDGSSDDFSGTVTARIFDMSSVTESTNDCANEEVNCDVDSDGGWDGTQYTKAGTWSTTKTVVDEFMMSGTKTFDTTIPNSAPSFTKPSLDDATAGTAQTFTFSVPSDSDGTITRVVVEFGDGNSQIFEGTGLDGSSITATHTYEEACECSVIATAYDNSGGSTAQAVTVSVGERTVAMEPSSYTYNLVALVGFFVLGILLAATSFKMQQGEIAGDEEMNERDRQRLESVERRMESLAEREELLEVSAYDASRAATKLEEHISAFNEVLVRAQEIAAEEKLKELEAAEAAREKEEEQMQLDLEDPDIEMVAERFHDSLGRLVKARDELSKIEEQLAHILKMERDEQLEKLTSMTESYEKTKRKIEALQSSSDARNAAADENNIMNLLSAAASGGGAADFGDFGDFGDSDEFEVEIYEDEDGSFYYIDPDTGEEVPCDEDGNAL